MNYNNNAIILDVVTKSILLERIISIDLPAPQLAERSEKIESENRIKALCKLMQREIEDGPGYCVLELPDSEHLSNQEIASGCWNIFTSLCRPLKQYGSSDNLIYEVKTNPNAIAHSAYSSTSHGEGCHTDGTFLEQPPHYVALACIQPSISGGESILVDGKAVFDAIKRENDALALQLLEKFHFDCAGQFDDVQSRHEPIISFDQNGRIRVRYMRAYIEAGQTKMRGEVSKLEREALDYLDSKILSLEFRVVFPLSRGQLVIFNNHRLFHGRTEFSDSTDISKKRLLLRFYGQPRM